MAFTGAHFVTGYKGGFGFRKAPVADGQAPLNIVGSESTATGTKSTLQAPDYSSEFGQPWLQVYAAADSWVAVGANPDPSANPRILVKGLTTTLIPVKPGDFWKWVAA